MIDDDDTPRKTRKTQPNNDTTPENTKTEEEIQQELEAKQIMKDLETKKREFDERG